MLKLLIFAGIVFLVLKGTTFGWKTFRRPYFFPPEETETAERLKARVRELSEAIGSRSVFDLPRLEKAAEYVRRQLGSSGYAVETQSYASGGTPVGNLIAVCRGKTRPGEVIVVGAHYDTALNPGADDNASGVAVLLELAQRAATRPPPERTIKFVFFVNEEPPFYRTEEMGSRVFVREAKKGKETIRGALILESVGYYSGRLFSQRYPLLFGPFYPGQGDFIVLVGDFRSRRLAGEIVSTFRRHSRFPLESVITFASVPGADFSDHWSFWQEGIPAVMFTDTAFYRNPHYHQDSDTWEKLDYRRTAEFARALDRALEELAGGGRGKS